MAVHCLTGLMSAIDAASAGAPLATPAIKRLRAVTMAVPRLNIFAVGGEGFL